MLQRSKKFELHQWGTVSHRTTEHSQKVRQALWEKGAFIGAKTAEFALQQREDSQAIWGNYVTKGRPPIPVKKKDESDEEPAVGLHYAGGEGGGALVGHLDGIKN